MKSFGLPQSGKSAPDSLTLDTQTLVPPSEFTPRSGPLSDIGPKTTFRPYRHSLMAVVGISFVSAVGGCCGNSSSIQVEKSALETSQGELMTLFREADGSRSVLYRQTSDLTPRLTIHDRNNDGQYDDVTFDRVPRDHPFRRLTPRELQGIFDRAAR